MTSKVGHAARGYVPSARANRLGASHPKPYPHLYPPKFILVVRVFCTTSLVGHELAAEQSPHKVIFSKEAELGTSFAYGLLVRAFGPWIGLSRELSTSARESLRVRST